MSSVPTKRSSFTAIKSAAGPRKAKKKCHSLFIRIAVNKKNKLHKHLKLHPDDTAGRQEYKELSLHCKSLVNKHKIAIEEKVIHAIMLVHFINL